MGVRGDFAQLALLRAKLKDAGGGALKARLLKAAAAEALTQVKLGFRAQQDPSGKPWKPLKSRKGMILRKTSRMANSFTARPTDSGFVIGSNVTYSPFHQDGTRRMAKRMMLPGDQKLTPKWRAAIDAAADIALKNFLKST